MNPTPINLVAIMATNSRSFIEEVLRLYDQQTPLVILRSKEQLALLKGAQVERVIEPEEGFGWIHHKQTRFHNTDNLAQITFTSGTEGQPKAIALSHRALNDVVVRVNEAMQLDASVKEYVGVPASYSFGLARLRACAALGGSTYIPERGFDPVEIAKMLENDEINAFSAVPTLIRTLLAYPELFSDHGSKLRWIEIGSQYMAGDEKQQLRELFPNAKIVQHYGLTEASRSTFLDITYASDESLESVGQPTGDAKVRISDDGRIEIRGPHIASGILNADGIVPIVGDQGWLRTNDLGEMRDGFLYYLGRSDDQINCGGIKLSPEAIEQHLFDRLNIHQGIAIARIPDPIRGDGVLVCFTPQTKLDAAQVEQSIKDTLEHMGLQVGNALHTMLVDTLPMTGSGKVQRSELASMYQPEQPSVEAPTHQPAHSGDADDLESKLVAAWQSVLRQETVSLHTSFYEHGGDSLSSIALMLSLERAHVDRDVTARVFDGETIAQIVATHDAMREGTAQRAPRTNDRIAGDTINSVRGMLVLWLICIHFLPGLLERLPVNADEISRWLNPLYRMGTPGFAIIFGLGVGYFFLHQMDKNISGVMTRIRIATIMVAVGIGILAIVRYAKIKFTGDYPSVPISSVLLYSVLMYYLLAVLSIPFWHRLLSAPSKRVGGALMVSAVCFGIDLFLEAVVTHKTYDSGLAELISLMTMAKYNYFVMTGTVMLGVAVGSHFHQSVHNIRNEANTYLMGGGLMIAASVLLSIDTNEITTWLDMGSPPITLIVGYLGLIVLMLGMTIRILSIIPRSGIASTLIAILAACGVLSLPMFIGHELVIPSKAILVSLGLPSSVSLLASLGVFLLIAGYFVRRVMRIYS